MYFLSSPGFITSTVAQRIQYLRAFLRVQPCQKLIILHTPLRFQLLYTLFCAARGIFLYLLGASGKNRKRCEAAQGAAFGAEAMKIGATGAFSAARRQILSAGRRLSGGRGTKRVKSGRKFYGQTTFLKNLHRIFTTTIFKEGFAMLVCLTSQS